MNRIESPKQETAVLCICKHCNDYYMVSCRFDQVRQLVTLFHLAWNLICQQPSFYEYCYSNKMAYTTKY